MNLAEAENFLRPLEGIFDRKDIDSLLTSLTTEELESMNYEKLIERLYKNHIQEVERRLRKGVPKNFVMMCLMIGMLVIFIILLLNKNIFV